MKVHMLDVHLNEFKKNLGAYSEEHGECFHQDIKYFECGYQRQYNKNMMGDYIWGLIQESDLQYQQKSRKKVLFEMLLYIVLVLFFLTVLAVLYCLYGLYF